MCTPFPEGLEEGNARVAAFNKAHSRARNPVETTIGIVKARFPVMKTGPRLEEMEDCSKLVQICFALHNFLLDKNYPPPEEKPSSATPADGSMVESLNDPELDDTLPLSDGEPENINLDAVEDMHKPATNQVLLDKYF